MHNFLRALNGAFVELQKATISFLMYPCLSPSLSVLRSVWSPSAWNNSTPTGQIFLTFDISVCFGNCRENLIFVKIWEERVLSMTTCVHLWWHLAQFFLEWGIFQTSFAFPTVNNGGSIFDLNVYNINRITWISHLVRMHYVRIYIKLMSDAKSEKYYSFLSLAGPPPWILTNLSPSWQVISQKYRTYININRRSLTKKT